MAAPSQKFARAWYALGALLGVGACDPNVVIGTRWHVNGDAGSVASGGGALPVAGMGGVTTGAVAGDSAGIAGEAGLPFGGAGNDAGGAGGADDVPPIFSTGMEDGTVNDWDVPYTDADAGGFYADSDPPPVSSKAISHSGAYSAEVVIDTSSGADQISTSLPTDWPEGGVLQRLVLFERGSHAERLVVGLSISSRQGSQQEHRSGQWVNLPAQRLSNTPTVALFDHQYDGAKGRTIDVAPQPLIQVGVWFQIRAYLQQEDGMPSHVTLWINGQEVLDLPGATPAPHLQPLYWVVGNGGSKMTPPKSTDSPSTAPKSPRRSSDSELRCRISTLPQ